MPSTKLSAKVEVVPYVREAYITGGLFILAAASAALYDFEFAHRSFGAILLAVCFGVGAWILRRRNADASPTPVIDGLPLEATWMTFSRALINLAPMALLLGLLLLLPNPLVLTGLAGGMIGGAAQRIANAHAVDREDRRQGEVLVRAVRKRWTPSQKGDHFLMKTSTD